jgi:sugar lactone lactonase YvrE
VPPAKRGLFSYMLVVLAVVLLVLAAVYVYAEWANGRIQKFSLTGEYLGKINHPFVYFQFIDVDDPGDLDLVFGTSGSGDGEFGEPPGIAADDKGYIYVTEIWRTGF